MYNDKFKTLVTFNSGEYDKYIFWFYIYAEAYELLLSGICQFMWNVSYMTEIKNMTSIEAFQVMSGKFR
jgi:hypothetical protein